MLRAQRGAAILPRRACSTWRPRVRGVAARCFWHLRHGRTIAKWDHRGLVRSMFAPVHCGFVLADFDHKVTSVGDLTSFVCLMTLQSI